MVCRIKNRHTFKSLPILNSAYFTECRFVIRHITQTDTETETEANFTHFFDVKYRMICWSIIPISRPTYLCNLFTFILQFVKKDTIKIRPHQRVPCAETRVNTRKPCQMIQHAKNVMLPTERVLPPSANW